ncbi:MAG: S-layer homology domain-containing protein, partial [Bacillota bacterium]|nr:S-layer homology domain-containing protein [Bacillota bacterium]
MGKRIIIIFIALLLVLPNIVYAEIIDLDQMNFIFDQIRQADEGKKDFYIDVFNYFFGSDDNIDYLINNFNESIRQEDLDKMNSLGITEADVKANLKNLKTWDKSDRLKLIDYAIMEDQGYAKEQIQVLNDKYRISNEDTSQVEDSLESGTNIGLIPKEVDEQSDEVRYTLKEKLHAKGLITKPIAIVTVNKSFQDVENHWSKKYVNFFAERNIINGRTEENFEPDGYIKENEIIKLLMVVTVKEPEKLEFNNISLEEGNEDQWYSIYLKQAKKLGVISEEDSSIKITPENYPNREKIIHLIIRTLNVLEIPMDEELKVYKGDFTDFEQIDEAYKESIIIAHNLGLIDGNANATLTPKREITRGEVSKILNGFY